MKLHPESDIGKFLAANKTVTLDAVPQEPDRHSVNKYRSYRPSSKPHATCRGCPMLRDCPLLYYISPPDGCVFRWIVEARVRS